MELGEEGLEEDDKFLLEINLDELDASSGEDQTYWLLALEAARDARQLRLCQVSVANGTHELEWQYYSCLQELKSRDFIT